MRWMLIGVGVLLILIGGLWTLQGIGMLMGSFMSSQPFWAIVGVVVLLLGVLLCFLGLRRRAVI